jgi:hypothetical protein
MGVRYNPRIVTSGLVGCWDAGNTKSYPGSGTTWTQIMTSNYAPQSFNNLVNTTYSSNNGGHLDFSSSGARSGGTISTGGLLFGTNDYTWEFWAMPATVTADAYLFRTGWQIYIVQQPSNLFSYHTFTSGTGSTLYTTGFGTVIPGNWYHFVASRIGLYVSLYINGVKTVENIDSLNYEDPTFLWLASSSFSASVNPFGGKISIIRVYNGVGLTQDQVKQNFNATRGRYGR